MSSFKKLNVENGRVAVYLLNTSFSGIKRCQIQIYLFITPNLINKRIFAIYISYLGR